MDKKRGKNQNQGKERRTFPKAKSLGAAGTLGAPMGISSQSEPKAVKKESGEKIDIFCHILPRKYNEVLLKKSKPCYYHKTNSSKPALIDLDIRFRVMDKYEGLRQVLTLGAPPIEYAVSPKDAVELARMANDEMAELVNKYPDRFVAAVASLPMNDIDDSLRETERAIKELKFRGIQIASSINGKPLDSPEFLRLYERMAQYDLPIWIHPTRDRDIPDYPGEKSAKYGLFVAFAWPFETTIAMGRLVYSGVMEKYPNLKIVAHHCGAMLPFFSARIPPVSAAGEGEIMKLTRQPAEYFKRFYGDTVLGSNTSALMCGYTFFGADQMVFATDYPYTGEVGIEAVVKAVERMNITEEEKAKIFSKNAMRILGLP
jgi:predicted TIM-barrel fold metal-dependent hydrolase